MNQKQLATQMRSRNLSVIGDLPTETKAHNMLQALSIIIPPKDISDRTSFKNLVWYFRDVAIGRGEEPDAIFRVLIDFALEASGPKSRNPAAVFMSILQKELGYKGKVD